MNILPYSQNNQIENARLDDIYREQKELCPQGEIYKILILKDKIKAFLRTPVKGSLRSLELLKRSGWSLQGYSTDTPILVYGSDLQCWQPHKGSELLRCYTKEY